MKNFIGILLSLILGLSAYAYEDFLISVGDIVAQIKNNSPEIIDVKTQVTIMNERNLVIVTCLKEGIGKFSLMLENGKVEDFQVTVNKKESKIETSANFEIFTIDDISKEWELDLPPGVK